jgi:aromatic-L-amino-acid decarboxylase
VEEATPLALTAGAREALLGRAAAAVTEAWRSFDRYREGQPPLDPAIVELLTRPLPEDGTDAAACLADAVAVLDESLAQTRPRFFAFIGGSGLEIGVLGDLLAACFDVNLASWAGAASEIEAQTVRWVAELVGYPAAGGMFTSGGTVSTVTALAAAREAVVAGARREGVGGRRLAVYCSAEAHHSVVRAVELLGIGSRGLRTIPADERRRLRPDLLADALDEDRRNGVVPIAVIATAGTTLTGAVDPLEPIADLCAEHGAWLHVDGAYGAPAAALPETAALFAGLDRANSVSVDAHKWLYVPKACGVLLVRSGRDLETAFVHEDGYFPHERQQVHAADTTLEYSRPFRALKLWLALRAHGAESFRTAIRRNLQHARLCHAEASAASDLEPLPLEPQLSIAPFRHVAASGDLDAHNAEIVRRLQASGDVWVASAQIDGATWLRPCFVNYRTTDEDVLDFVRLVRRVGGEVARSAA